MTVNKLNKVKLFINLLRFLEVMTVIITCIFLVRQTQENALSNKLQVAIFLREHYQTINRVLAEQKDARNVFKLDLNQVMGYMLLADYDLIYQMFEEKMIDGKKWKMLEHFMRKQMKDDNLPIKELWSKNRGARSPGFEDYVEACLYSDLYDSPAMNQGISGMQENGKLRGRLTKEQQIEIQKVVCPE